MFLPTKSLLGTLLFDTFGNRAFRLISTFCIKTKKPELKSAGFFSRSLQYYSSIVPVLSRLDAEYRTFNADALRSSCFTSVTMPIFVS